MAKKLKLNPKTSYVLGMYAYNKGDAIGIVTKNNEIVAKFVKIVMDEFGIEPNKVLISGEDHELKVHFYNSKLKKLLEHALDRREKTFKYKNEYSANYFAGIFDANGGKDARGLYIRDLNPGDGLVAERLGFHTVTRAGKTYILNDAMFIAFVKDCSVRSPKPAKG